MARGPQTPSRWDMHHLPFQSECHRWPVSWHSTYLSLPVQEERRRSIVCYSICEQCQMLQFPLQCLWPALNRDLICWFFIQRILRDVMVLFILWHCHVMAEDLCPLRWCAVPCVSFRVESKFEQWYERFTNDSSRHASSRRKISFGACKQKPQAIAESARLIINQQHDLAKLIN